MPRQWFYSHNGHNFGPVSGRQLKYLAATGGLQPEDLIWPEGDEPEQGTVAREALDFTKLRRLAQEVQRRRALNKALTAEDQLFEWTDEIDRLFRDPEQAQGPVPEWLQPAKPVAAELPDWLNEAPAEEPPPPPAEPAEPPVPVAPAVPIAPPVAAPVGGGLLERIGIDPLTEQVVDWGKLKAWLQDQMRQRPGELPVPTEMDPDPFQTARRQLAAWFDLPKNRDRVKYGERAAIREDPALRLFMNHFQRYGADKQARLWEFVDFLIEARSRDAAFGDA